MWFIDNEGITDPSINLAIEEYCLQHMDIDNTYLLFYVNRPAIIIGKNQNAYEEINTEYVQNQKIHVVRRLSGGGAVYHDEGNLNFSFITRNDGASFHNFRKFTQPLIDALHELGVPAELSGRNDIVVEGRKISGNAQFATRGRMFSHGTLLLNSDIDNVVSALHVKADKIESKGIKSIRSRVANINEFLSPPLTMEAFKQTLITRIFGSPEHVPTYKLTDEDWQGIRALSESRYRSWEWNFGKSPRFNVQRTHRFPIGAIDVRLDVEQGVIEHCRIFGDFFGIGEVSDIEQRLTGVRYAREVLEQALSDADLSVYFGNLEKEEFLDLLI